MKRIFTRRRLLLQFAVEDDGWPFHSGLYRTHDANSFGCRSRRLPRQRHAAWQYNKRKPIKKYIYMRDRLYCYLFDPRIRWCCKCIFIFQPLRAPPTNPQYINKDHKISASYLRFTSATYFLLSIIRRENTVCLFFIIIRRPLCFFPHFIFMTFN